MNIELPILKMKHEPGFRWEWFEDPNDGNNTVIVFESTQEELGLSFEIDAFIDDKTISQCLVPDGSEWIIKSSKDLLGIAEACNSFSVWLKDCATVLEWAQRNQWLITSRDVLKKKIALAGKCLSAEDMQ